MVSLIGSAKQPFYDDLFLVSLFHLSGPSIVKSVQNRITGITTFFFAAQPIERKHKSQFLAAKFHCSFIISHLYRCAFIIIHVHILTQGYTILTIPYFLIICIALHCFNI